jgi:hypothetical protein
VGYIWSHGLCERVSGCGVEIREFVLTRVSNSRMGGRKGCEIRKKPSSSVNSTRDVCKR